MYIVDLETTGLYGYPHGHVVIEISIFDSDTCTEVYHTLINPTTYRHFRSDWKNAWIFNNTHMTPEQVLNGISFTQARDDVARILTHRQVSSYNTSFDLNKYLMVEPWNIQLLAAPCIMRKFAALYNGGRLMKLQHAWEKYGPGTELNWHTATADTYAATWLYNNKLKIFNT